MVEESKQESKEKDYKLGKASSLMQQHFNHQSEDMYKSIINGDKPSLRNLYKKRLNRKDRLKIARNFVWSVGLLYRIIKLKVDFIIDGFEIYHDQPKVEKEFRELNEKLNIKEYIKNAAFEHEVIGEWYPFLNWNNDELNNLTILNPEQVKVKSIFGEDFIYLRPPDEIKQLLNDPDKVVQQRLKRIIPSNYYDKWSTGQEVLLEEDEAFRYCSMKPNFQGYNHSPIEPIFDDLALLSMYKESDYSIAYKIKKAILQVKVGDNDVFDGEPVPEEILEQAEKLFDNPSESAEVFTQWFMEADWIIPDVKVYAPEKYEPVIRNILQWSGVGIFLSEGGAYSDADIKEKGFYRDVKTTRELIKKSILDIYKAIAEKKGMTTYHNKLKFPKVKFSDKALQDPEHILERSKFLYKHGLLSPETTLDTFEYDYNRELNIKSKEGKKEEYMEYITVPFEPSQDVNMKSFKRRELERETEQEEDEDTSSEEVKDE